jgi:hypothetical protein
VNSDLVALDDKFRKRFSFILERFFLLFDGIVRYYQDLVHYLDDLQEGVYVQSTIESVMENEDGRQLLVEALVLSWSSVTLDGAPFEWWCEGTTVGCIFSYQVFFRSFKY